MPEYLLPCSCGQKLTVSTRQAGESVHCACGATLEVPTLRGLAQLERADTAAAGTRRTWGGRQQAVFVLVVLTVCCLGLAGYLALTLPAAPLVQELPELRAESPLSDVYAVAEDAKSGLNVPPPGMSPEDSATIAQRENMIWAIKISLAAAGCGLASAVVVLLSGRGQKR